jgi:NAD(P)H-dependent FMN reductase
MSNVVALLGSLRQDSITRLALNVALEGVRNAGLEANLQDLGAPRLPLFEEGVTSSEPTVLQFKEAIRSCDALLVATPVYHDSYSGVLKNAIDHLYDELSDKVIGLVAVGGGRTGQGQALEHLRAVFRETGSWVLPRQVAIPSAKDAFEAGKLKDPELEWRLIKLGQELVLRSRQLRPKKSAAVRKP